MKIQSKALTVEIDVARAVFDVIQRRGGLRWAMDLADDRDLVVRRYNKDEIVLSLAKARNRTAAILENGSVARLEYAGFDGSDSSLSVAVLLTVSGESLAVEISANDADPNFTFDSLMAKNIVAEIRKATGRKFSAEDKIRSVLEGLRGQVSVWELCRREGIAPTVYYRWSKDFLEAGKKRERLNVSQNQSRTCTLIQQPQTTIVADDVQCPAT